jgi:hypothetical protein
LWVPLFQILNKLPHSHKYFYKNISIARYSNAVTFNFLQSVIIIIILIIIEIQRMWNVKTRVIPVIIGATGTISKSFRKYVSSVPGNHEVKELQETAILGTAHILRKVLT